MTWHSCAGAAYARPRATLIAISISAHESIRTTALGSCHMYLFSISVFALCDMAYKDGILTTKSS